MLFFDSDFRLRTSDSSSFLPLRPSAVEPLRPCALVPLLPCAVMPLCHCAIVPSFIQIPVALRAVGFFPGGTNIYRVFEFEVFPDTGIFHGPGLALSYDTVTEIAVT